MHSRWLALKIPGKGTTFFISTFKPQEDNFSLILALVTCNTFTLDDDSTVFTRKWKSIIIPFWEITKLTASLLIVLPIPSTGPFQWLDAKKFQCTFKLNLLSNEGKHLAIKEFLRWMLGPSDNKWRMLTSFGSKEFSKVFRKSNADFFEWERSPETTLAGKHSPHWKIAAVNTEIWLLFS